MGDKTGTENYSYHLVTQILQLPEAKSHTFVLFTRPNAIIPEEVKKSNVQVQLIKFRYLWTQVGLAWATRQRPFVDVLWVPAHTLPLLRRSGMKTVVTIHGLEYQWLPEYRNWLQRWYLPLSTYYAARSADHLIAVSRFTKEQLVKELQTNPKRIKVIQEGVLQHLTTIGKLDQKNTLARYTIGEQPYILFVGTIQPRKNIPALVEAFAMFSAHYPDYKLVIAGSIGWMAGPVFQAPGRYGVQEKVVFTGRVSDLALSSLYQGAFLYVQPSITEGFGLPVLEAMGRGVPVISSDGGALPETVDKAGIIVQQGLGFAQRLAEALLRVAGEPKLYAQLIVAGRKRVTALSWAKAARETLAVLVK